MTKAQQHPTGITAALAAAAVVIAKKLNLDLSAEEAAIIVGAVAALVSVFSPRKV